MENEPIVKKMYPFEKMSLSSGKSYQIIMEEPRSVEILSATEDGIEDKKLRVLVKSDEDFRRYFYKEEGLEITPATPLPNNKKFTVAIPMTDQEPIFNLFPGDGNMSSLLQFPLKPFIDTETDDPVKMFVFHTKSSENMSSVQMNGDTSYLNGMDFSPVSDDDETLLFSQQLSNSIDLPDGPIDIDLLDEETSKEIATQIIGTGYEEEVDENKLPAGAQDEFWTVKKGVSTGATTGHAIWNHRRVLKDFGFKGKFFIKTVKGKQYVIFRGYSGLRKWYTGTRYKATNPKVVNLSAAGKMKSGLKGNAVTILIVGAIDVVDWMLSEEEDKQFEDLCVTLGMDALKVVVGSIIATGITAAILAIVAGATLPVSAVIVGAIVIGVAVGFGLDWLDSKIGATEFMKEKGRKAGSFLENKWDEHVIEPLGRMYYKLEKTIQNMYLRQMRPNW